MKKIVALFIAATCIPLLGSEKLDSKAPQPLSPTQVLLWTALANPAPATLTPPTPLYLPTRLTPDKSTTHRPTHTPRLSRARGRQNYHHGKRRS